MWAVVTLHTWYMLVQSLLPSGNARMTICNWPQHMERIWPTRRKRKAAKGFTMTNICEKGSTAGLFFPTGENIL